MSGPRVSLAVLLTLCAGVAPAEAAGSGCSGADHLPANVRPVEARTATLCVLNAERARRGLRRLRPNGRLARAAVRHGHDMVRRGYFAHDSLDGRDFATRIRATGYLHRAVGWTVGENLAWGSSVRGTPRMIVAAWMASPPHRRNILNRRFTAVGIAVVRGAPADVSDGATYVTDFGHRA